jgi:hypothetical protein
LQIFALKANVHRKLKYSVKRSIGFSHLAIFLFVGAGAASMQTDYLKVSMRALPVIMSEKN